MRAIIAGGRDFVMKPIHEAWLDSIHSALNITQIIEGGATGADRGGAKWARSAGIEVHTVIAEWQRLGRSAGPRRNKRMAQYCAAKKRGVCILFPGGAGTASMKRCAQHAGLQIIEYKE